MKKDPRAYLLFVLALLLAGCGGGSGSSAPATNDVQGLWSGTYQTSSTTTVPLYAIITADGSSYFFDANGLIYVLPVSATLDGTATAYASGLNTFEVNGQFVSQAPVTLTSSGSAATLTGNISFSDGTTFHYSLSPYKPFTGKPSVVTTSTWSGVALGDRISFPFLSALSDGVISGGDGACSVSGNINQVGTGEDLFTVRYELLGTSTSPCNQAYDGLAFESTKDLTGRFKNVKGTYYYMVLSNPNAALVYEFMAP